MVVDSAVSTPRRALLRRSIAPGVRVLSSLRAGGLSRPTRGHGYWLSWPTGWGFSAAMSPTKTRRRGHHRGRVLTDLAIAIADGASAISDLRVAGRISPIYSARWPWVPTARRALGPSINPRPRDSPPRRPKRARRRGRPGPIRAGMSLISTACWSRPTPIDFDGLFATVDSAATVARHRH